MKKTSKWIQEYSANDYAVTDRLFENWIPRHKEIWLFGTGVYAYAWRHYMLQCGFSIDGFVVSMPESNISTTGEPIISVEDFKARYELGKTGVILTLDSDYYSEILPGLLFAQEDLFFLKEKHKSLALKRYHFGGADDNMLVACLITEHCNLSCYSCDAASPIAEKNFADADRIIDDFKRLRQIVGENVVEHISFGGGEPLLHPQFIYILENVRKIFQDCREINFYTNGVLLGEQTEEFYKGLVDSDITVMWTKYPINYKDESLIYENTKKYGVDLRLSPDLLYSPKKSGHIVFDSQGRQKRWDYLYCVYHNFRAQLSNGRLYTCPIMTTSEIVSRKFGVNLPVEDSDNIDIYKVSSKTEILDFMRKRSGFCDYCAVRHRHIEEMWMPSKREKSEWILDEAGAKKEC